MQFNSLFERAFKSKASNQFENLPKYLLSKIIGYLEKENVIKMFLLNSFFLKIMSENSNATNLIWKTFLPQDLNQEELSLSIKKEIRFTPFEEKMNSIYLLFKVENLFISIFLFNH